MNVAELRHRGFYTKHILCFVTTQTNLYCSNLNDHKHYYFPGNKTWTTGFGMEDIAAGKPVDANSKFNIASLTKAFTATLLGILLQEKGCVFQAPRL